FVRDPLLPADGLAAAATSRPLQGSSLRSKNAPTCDQTGAFADVAANLKLVAIRWRETGCSSSL
ncbi:MAG: hypothetical protein KA482_12115, partial [Sphingobium sp.]|nr:hypothetical protein [Sphingobium sp.]